MLEENLSKNTYKNLNICISDQNLLKIDINDYKRQLMTLNDYK